jgi:dihydrolipoamide dehydrogenase
VTPDLQRDRAGAREAAASAEVDVQAALGWRDVIVSNYSDTRAAQWLVDRKITALRALKALRVRIAAARQAAP